jgi:hypothetical protein
VDPLLQYLDREGVLTVSGLPATPAEYLVQRYRRWLVDGRGLSQATVVRRLSRRHRRAHDHHRGSSHGLGYVFAVSANRRLPTPRV